MSTFPIPWPRKAKHDPDSIIRRLRADVASLLDFKAAADDYFALLTQDRDEVYRCWKKAAADRDTAEQLAACLAEDNERLWQRLAPFEAAEANRTAVTVPPAERDIDPDDQPTHPTGIDVREVRERFASGPVVSLHHAPQADPGQTAWGAAREAADTEPVPVVDLPQQREAS